jgi:hypothetical protein
VLAETSTIILSFCADCPVVHFSDAPGGYLLRAGVQSVRVHSDAGEPPALHMLPSMWLCES